MTPLHGGDLILLMVRCHLIALSAGGRAAAQLRRRRFGGGRGAQGASANSISLALGLPRRTVLRKVKVLVESGATEKLRHGSGGGGVEVLGEVEAECTRLFLLRAREYLEVLAGLELCGVSAARVDAGAVTSAILFGAANALCLDLLVHLAEWTEGDVMLGIVFLAICNANTRHIDQDGVFSYLDFQPSMPDGARRPISMLALAQELAVPRETTRRYANKLIAAGACKLVRGGVVANEEIFAAPAVRAASERNRRRVRQFVADLAAAV